MRLAKMMFILTMLVAVLPAFANPEKVPGEESGYALDRVECDLSGMDYYDMFVGDTFDNTGGPITYGPLPAPGSGFLSKVVLSIDIDQTWIGDLVIDLYYDHDGNGTYDAGPVSALCRPNLDGCAYDGCCGCSMDVLGVYTFGDDGAAPMGDPDCPGAVVPNGCFQEAPESPFSFAGAFNGLPAGGNFYLEIADGAGADETTLFGWGVYVNGNPTELTVKPDGTGDVPTIQDAIHAIAEGGIIYLTDGVFQGPGNWDLFPNGKNFELRSASLDPETCIIDGNAGPGPASFPAGSSSSLADRGPVDRDYGNYGIYYVGGETTSSILNGITFRHFSTAGYGSAVYIFGSSPTIENCRFEWNSSSAGGAIMIEEGDAPNIIGCVFDNNMTSAFGFGGAVCVWKPPANVTIDGCTFHNNNGYYGGAIYLEDAPMVVVENSILYDNTGEWGGAAMSQFIGASGTPEFRFCTFSENIAALGGHFHIQDDVRSWFNILAFANGGGSVYWDGFGIFDIACTDIFGNVEGDWIGPLAGMEASDGNMHSNPEFCGSLGTWDYRLQEDSPCALGNNGCGQNIGAFGAECGPSATAETTWSEVKLLY